MNCFHPISQIVSLTELMAGVKAPTKTVQLFQLTCFPLGHKVSQAYGTSLGTFKLFLFTKYTQKKRKVYTHLNVTDMQVSMTNV